MNRCLRFRSARLVVGKPSIAAVSCPVVDDGELRHRRLSDPMWSRRIFRDLSPACGRRTRDGAGFEDLHLLSLGFGNHVDPVPTREGFADGASQRLEQRRAEGDVGVA